MIYLLCSPDLFFLPLFSGDGPFPGVIDLFGTAGGIIEFRSALLASRGIASLSLPYFRYEDLPDTLYDLDLEYFMVRNTQIFKRQTFGGIKFKLLIVQSYLALVYKM